jgi:hypothetical protein
VGAGHALFVSEAVLARFLEMLGDVCLADFVEIEGDFIAPDRTKSKSHKFPFTKE